MKVVAVGIDNQGVPHLVAYKGFSRVQAAASEFVVERDCVVALEAQGHAFAAFFFGNAGGEIFLEH